MAARDHHQPMLPETRGWVGGSAPWAGKIPSSVTTMDERSYPGEALARLYRERADAENIYDELKNQWGWNGYTTQKLGPTRLMAKLVALMSHWWNARLYDGEHHREAITSRPALLSGVGRLLRHGGQRTVKVSLQHEKAGVIGEAIPHGEQHFGARERLLLTYILLRWPGGKWLGELPSGTARLLCG